MENYNMKPGLKLMSLGFNCYLTLLEERIRGPFDNIVCDSIKHLQAIFNKEYLNIVSNINNVRFTPSAKYIDSLNLAILHNEYNEHFLENQAKRVKNFEEFIEKAKMQDDYYFIAYILNETIAEDCKNFLKKEGLFEKTIIFSHHKKVCDLFKNSIFITPPNGKASWSLDIIKQLLKYFNDHDYKTKWWWNWDTSNPPKDWKNFNLNPNLNYMALGYNHFFNCVASRVRGPVDNLFCKDACYIYKLCDESYLKIALDDKNIRNLHDSIYHIDSLNLNIIHDKPDTKWKNQQIEKYANFRKFINNLQNPNDYYFLLYVIDEKYVFEYKKALEDNSLMDKTIVFSHEKKYLELFKNRVLIDIDFKLDTSKNEVIWWCQPLADKIYKFFQTNGFIV